ncbi:MAG: hypothetical protein FWE25_04095 [Lachnospiraceae bacterium]|nr:hypothetical protein [Lachnospiraceae bacterium]
MKKIITVNGAKAPDEIGFCQSHEHLLISKGVSATLNQALCIDDINKSTVEVRAFKSMGGNTLVDAQPGGCNRVAEGLAQISKDTGVHIICSTGFHKHAFYPKDHWLFTYSLEQLKDVYVHELEVGVFRDIDSKAPKEWVVGLRAGIIKTALDVIGLTPQYLKCFEAAAKAAIHCDVPMKVHIDQEADHVALLGYLQKWGINPRKIMFCHMDREIKPLSFYLPVLEKGITLEFDTIGRFKYHDDESEAKLIKELIDAGYGNQILCSLDTTRERLKAYHPEGIGLCYLFTSFFPLLREYGITEAQIEKMTHDNFVRLYNH